MSREYSCHATHKLSAAQTLPDLFPTQSLLKACCMQVELYADYAPQELLSFLVSSQWYPLEAALQVCTARGLVREQVFILGRMGSADQALHLIIQRLADIPQVCLRHTPLLLKDLGGAIQAVHLIS